MFSWGAHVYVCVNVSVYVYVVWAQDTWPLILSWGGVHACVHVCVSVGSVPDLVWRWCACMYACMCECCVRTWCCLEVRMCWCACMYACMCECGVRTWCCLEVPVCMYDAVVWWQRKKATSFTHSLSHIDKKNLYKYRIYLFFNDTFMWLERKKERHHHTSVASYLQKQTYTIIIFTVWMKLLCDWRERKSDIITHSLRHIHKKTYTIIIFTIWMTLLCDCRERRSDIIIVGRGIYKAQDPAKISVRLGFFVWKIVGCMWKCVDLVRKCVWKCVFVCIGVQRLYVFCVICIYSRVMYLHSHNNWCPRNGFQRFLVPGYYWKTVEKSETDPQRLWEWHFMVVCESQYVP